MVTEMFKQTCRTCLSTNGEMIPIFSSGFYVNQLPKKLMAFIKVEISENDALPKMICKKCMFLADSFYCFKEQCKFAEDRLKLLIQKSLNKEHYSLNETEKIDLNNKNNKIEDNNLNVRNFKKEPNNTLEENQEIEDNYIVDYISDEVRIQVENASKRRQEAERKISMKKVSQTIMNLKGIEIVPIGELTVAKNERNCRIKQEEIVMFPVKVPKKRCKVIETIIIDDPPPLKKRLKLSPEATISKINGRSVKTEDCIVYGKYKKVNFSTIRKIVKIDDEDFCTEPKLENGKESDKENCRIKLDVNDFTVSSDSDKQKRFLQFSEIQIDKKRSEFHSEKQEPNVLLELKDEQKILESRQFQVLDFVSNYNEINKQQNDPMPRNNKKCIEYPSAIEKPVKVLASRKSNEFLSHGVANIDQNQDIVTNSTIGCIISEIEDQDLDDINQTGVGERESTFENSNHSSDGFDDYYRMDENNEFVVEKKISNANDDDGSSKRSFGFREIESEKVKENSTWITGNRQQNSDRATPLALLSVNSSREENSEINLTIYKRNDSEGAEGAEEEDSSSYPNLENSNLKFYQCSICSMKFISRPVVLKHNIREHMKDEAPFSCLICDKSFQDKLQLCEHVEKHNCLRSYKCTFCPKTFTLKRNLKRHVNHHINYKPFQCRICMKRFTEKTSLKSHTYLHTGDSPFTCKTCNVSFNNKTNWRRHVVTIHQKITVVNCTFCNKELPDKRSLQVHSRVHTGDKPYQCPHCDKKFTQQCNLNTHIHRHFNDRPFACPRCGKSFIQRSTRDDHILTHTGEKPHKCMECGVGFTVSSALKRHMWIHTDKDRPYNCDKCKLQFVGLYDLRRHLKIRHGEVLKSENPRVERVQIDQRIPDFFFS